MFFYLLHLYTLRLLYLAAEAIWGTNQGAYFGFTEVSAIWLSTVVLTLALYLPVRWFAGLKARRREIRRLKYL
ncbi:hypothetical protein NBRC116187_02680 [Halopseudomonas sabulinigri]|uniref:Uncharacterized protein n=1 Tax=Halopseudomonas sabulinigri TaxID=472181 RepID=A0ABP9ZKA1_9GAMM